MTIDEAIAHEREVAIEQSSIATELLIGGCDASKYIECKEEHEQLAEWLEELKKYQKYGTPDGYGAALKAYDDCYFEKEEISNELHEYRQLGTLEEVRDAVEKQIPKSPTYEGDGYAPDGSFVWDEWICPHCGSRFEVEYDDYDYCPNCGQHIDWSEGE